jgi:hypothetical protein
MTGAPDHHDASAQRQSADAPVAYPTNHILAVVDSAAQLNAVRASLTNGGFLDSDIRVETGAERADAVDASTGHTGLAAVLIRFAERIGVTDEEMETKNVYEHAMRNDRFVVSIAADTRERKERATRILREHAAHSVAYFGKHSIEHIVPPNKGSERE